MTYPLTGFAPDLNQLTQGALLDCDGWYPSENGIATLPEAEAVADVLGGDCLGLISFRLLSGGNRTIAGTKTKLYELSVQSWTDISQAGDYTGTNNFRWHFAPYGNYLLAVNGSDDLQLSTGTDFAAISTDIPIAKFIETSKEFVFMANIVSDGGSSYQNRVQWSAQGDYTDWTPSLSTQSGYMDLVDVAGQITGISKIGDNVVVHKKLGLYLGTYVGPPYIWSFERIQGFAGAVNQECIIPIENGILYFATDDFYFFDGSAPKRIGAPVNQWFFDTVDRQNWDYMLGSYDPFRKLAFWYFPTIDDGTGACVDCLIFDFQRGNWGRNVISAQAATMHYQAVIDYDSIEDYWANYNAIDIPYNDPFWRAYSFDTGIVNDSRYLCRYTGTPTGVTFTTGDIGESDKIMRINGVRPICRTYPTSCSITPKTSNYLGGSLTSWTTGTLTNEKADVRSSGRYTRFDYTVSGLCEITGFDLDISQISRR